jgi:hypothetical protein
LAAVKSKRFLATAIALLNQLNFAAFGRVNEGEHDHNS